MPTQTLTIVFTDIERSTELWEQYPSIMDGVVTAHFVALEDAAAENDGRVVRKSGDGGILAFESSVDALVAAASIQKKCGAIALQGVAPLRIRIGVHTGECHVHSDDVFGRPVNLAARLENAAHGNQVLVSETTARLAGESLPDGFELIDLGVCSFKGLPSPMGVHQLHGVGMRRSFPPLRMSDTGRLGLPSEVRPLYGRERELAEAHANLADSRLVTLVGGPGIGKTRMAERLAYEVRRPYDDGVRFCSFRHGSSTTIEKTLATVLGLADVAEKDLEQVVVRSLHAFRVLLVLDNCEASLGRVRRLTRILLDQCPGVGILATSREPLLLPEETQVAVAPLPLPAPGSDRATYLDSPATRLFLEIARQADYTIEPATIDLELLEPVLRGTDGVPLAVELEASSLDTVSLSELAQRMTLGISQAPRRDAPASSRGLAVRSAIGSSFASLSDEERTVFETVSVFAAAFDQPAALDLVDLPEVDVVQALSSVTRKSLLQRDHGGGGSDRRYRMLHPLREYAVEQLSESRLGELRLRHAEVFKDRLRHDSARLRTSDEAFAAERMERDLNDHRSAIRYLIQAGRLDEADLAVIYFERFCHGRGYRDPYRFAAELVELGAADREQAAEVYGISALGAWLDGEMAAAVDIAKHGLAVERSTKPGARILLHMALVDSYGYLGALDQIGHHYSALITECRATGDPYWNCWALGLQGLSLALSGEAGRAEAKATEAIDTAVRLGNPDCLSWALFSYGTAVAEEDLGRATGALQRSTSAARSVGCSWYLLLSLDQLARFQLADGRLADAASAILEALDIIARIGNRSQLGQTYRLAASVLAASGESGADLLLRRSESQPSMPVASGLDAPIGNVRAEDGAPIDVMLLDDGRVVASAREALAKLIANSRD